MTDGTEILDPAALLAALEAGEPHRREYDALEKFVAEMFAAGDRKSLFCARKLLIGVRSLRSSHGESTSRVDALLAEVRPRLAKAGKGRT